MDIRRYAAVLLTLLTCATVRATHIGGGEIYWDHLGGDQYRITLIVYRDCAGVNLDNGYNLDISSPCGNMQLWVANQGTTEVSQLCGQQLPNSTCNGGTLPGIQRRVYTGTVNLPPCNSWTISWTEIYRNNAIVNLQDPGAQEVYIEGVLNNAAGPANDSPLFSNATAVPYVCLGYPVSYSYGAYDPEADSLSYEFIGARQDGANPIPYVAPYTGTQPITGITLDPVTGLVNFTLNVAGNWVVIVQVNEWDENGNLIGTIMRDMQFVAYPCSNAPPDPATGTVGAVSGTAVQTGPYSIRMCESGTACFDMAITDPNPNNVLEATSNIASNLPGATFSFTGTNPIQCHVCWDGGPGTAGFYPFIVNVNDGACPIVGIQTYVYTVEVIPGLYIDVTSADESCAGNCDGSASVNVLSGTGPYTISWSNGSIGQNIANLCAGTYTVQATDFNGCIADPGQAEIDTNDPPTAAGGNDVSICYGQWPVPMIGTATNYATAGWSGGTGLWSGTGTTMYYTPSAAEVSTGGADVVFTAQGNGDCPDATDQVHINISNTYTNASITPVNATCNGTATGSASFAPQLPGNTYVWNTTPPQTGATASNLMAGNYSVTVTDALGCSSSFSTTVGQPSALTITGINVTHETCAGQGNGTLTATASGGTGGQQSYTYLWSNNATGQTITVGAGMYSVTVTDANGCTSASAQATVNAAALPNSANAGADATVCMNDFPIALSGSVQNATGGTWSGGTGVLFGQALNTFYTPSAAEVAAGYVDLTLTTAGNTGCPPASDQIHLTISNGFLNAAVSTTPVLCNGGTGSAIFSPAQPGYGYQWFPSGQNGPVASGLPGGTHTVTVTDQFGCDTVMSVSLIDPPPLTVTTTQSAGPLCANSGNGYITVAANGGTPGYTYQWSANAGGQSTATASNLGAGAYQVTVTDSHGCTTQSSATLSAPAPITIAAQIPDTVCVNTPVQMTAQASGGTGAINIYWGGIGYGPSMTYSFPTSQTVSVSATDAVGCTSPILNFPVTVLDLSSAALVMSNDTTVCPGGVATVSAGVNNYPGAVNYQWTELMTTGPGPFTVPVTSTRTLHVLVTNACGQTLNGEVTLTLEVPPQITLPPVMATGCAPLTVQFPDSLTTQPVTWLWNFGDGTTSTAPAPEHTYAPGNYTITLTVATPAGCSANAQNTSSVTAYQGPSAAFSASTYQTDMDAPTVNFTNSSTGSINYFLWEFGDGDTSNTDNAEHTYMAVNSYTVTLTVTDVNGCTDEAQATINVIPVYDIDIPTAFTPDPSGGNNGVFDPSDMSNDVFYPIARFVKEFQMRVWNRWGELIFESNEVNKGWNGFYRGQLSPQDVYVYQAKIRFVDDRVAEKKGDITLLR